MSSFEGYDVDWFVFDKANRLVHFASGGGFLPNFITGNHIALAREILKLPVISPEVEFSPVLKNLVSFSNNKEFEEYVDSFTEYAKRGLHSYDKTELNNHEDPIYHLVAKPLLFLTKIDTSSYELSSICKIDNFLAESNLQVDVSQF